MGLLAQSPFGAAGAANRYRPAGGVGYENLHERIPNYHVRVIAPQLINPGLGAVNQTLVAIARGLTSKFRVDALAELRQIAPGFSRGHIPAGEFTIEPMPSLTSSSPVLIDSLLPLLSAYPNGVNSQWWKSAAVLIPSGKQIDLYEALFSRQATAIRTIAAVARQEIATGSWRATVCRNARIHEYGADPLPTVAAFVQAIANTHALALDASGLAVGVNQGELYEDACGLSDFIIPYRLVSPFLSPLGIRLTDSFEHEPLVRGFPARMEQALAFIARHTAVPVEGPTLTGTSFNTPPSLTASVNRNSYTVGFNYCPRPLPLNSPNIRECPQANVYIWGGFSARLYASDAAAQRSLLACDAWTCEVRSHPCPPHSKVVTIAGQSVRTCSGSYEYSWSRGTWLFIVQPDVPRDGAGDVAGIVQEVQRFQPPIGIGVLQNDQGGDNDNTVISWAVGRVVYTVDEYMGGGMDVAHSFRPLVP